MTLYGEVVTTPIGRMLLAVDEEGRLVLCHFAYDASVADLMEERERHGDCLEWDSSRTKVARLQLEEYFAGQRRDFDLPLAMRGTDFQRAVWNALLTVPFGKTASYRDIAVAIGKPAAVRAVGAANGANPIAVIVPCHRIIGSSGSLTGYGGGLDVKKSLLALENDQRPMW